MNGLIGGIAATNLGQGMEAFGADMSHSNDLQAELENRTQNAQLQLQGHQAYANAMFNSRETVAELNNENRNLKVQMAANLAAKNDPDNPDNIPSMANEVAAKTGLNPGVVLDAMNTVHNDKTAQLPPSMATAYGQVYAARKYGAGLKDISAGQVSANQAMAGGGVAQANQGTTDTNAGTAAVRAVKGETQVAGSPNGPISVSGADTDMNDAASDNAATAAEAKTAEAAAAGTRAASSGGGRGGGDPNQRKAVDAANTRIKQIDVQAAAINSSLAGRRPNPAQQQQLTNLANERSSLVNQSNTLIRSLAGPAATPSANPSVNPAQFAN